MTSLPAHAGLDYHDDTGCVCGRDDEAELSTTQFCRREGDVPMFELEFLHSTVLTHLCRANGTEHTEPR